MISATIASNGSFTLSCRVGGLPVYLDNFALIDLSEGNPNRRQRFVSCLQRGAELIFSVANLVELAGPQGKSIETMRTFLSEIVSALVSSGARHHKDTQL
jgi:hypothetical protein